MVFLPIPRSYFSLSLSFSPSAACNSLFLRFSLLSLHPSHVLLSTQNSVAPQATSLPTTKNAHLSLTTYPLSNLQKQFLNIPITHGIPSLPSTHYNDSPMTNLGVTRDYPKSWHMAKMNSCKYNPKTGVYNKYYLIPWIIYFLSLKLSIIKDINIIIILLISLTINNFKISND